MKRKSICPDRFARPAMSFFIVLAVFAACKKNNGGASINSASAIIGSAAFQSTQTVGVDNRSNHSFELNATQLKTGDTSAIDLFFPDTVKLNKAYTLDNDLFYVGYVTSKGQKFYFPDYFSPIGTLTVTSIDKSAHIVAGTFSGHFLASSTDSVVITNGKFNISYILQ